jgi:hypothetical protein
MTKHGSLVVESILSIGMPLADAGEYERESALLEDSLRAASFTLRTVLFGDKKFQSLGLLRVIAHRNQDSDAIQ